MARRLGVHFLNLLAPAARPTPNSFTWAAGKAVGVARVSKDSTALAGLQRDFGILLGSIASWLAVRGVCGPATPPSRA